MTHDGTGEDGRALKLTLVGTFLASIAVVGRRAPGLQFARAARERER